MAQQARAVQTRRRIVEAAAGVFDEYGYERAAVSEILRRAEVTKGALYFHFTSKEALAQAVMDEQTAPAVPPVRDSPLQTLIDVTQHLAYLLRTDSLVRAGARLAVEGVFYGGPHPWGEWVVIAGGLLAEAKERGEVLPHVVPEESAEVVVAAFTGVQLVSEASTGRADLAERVARMWQHFLPSIAPPATVGRMRAEGGADRAGPG
ncbi:ScbR family autoregulator-binding transcription factor [Streptomyces sp. NPDC002574]|uniref:ScbR family autoregulator-binding transcription factor n=1 Tax=Streptomyces sp. NPDC002574 TaxID=3364652 RepID=UPI00367ACB79